VDSPSDNGNTQGASSAVRAIVAEAHTDADFVRTGTGNNIYLFTCIFFSLITFCNVHLYVLTVTSQVLKHPAATAATSMQVQNLTCLRLLMLINQK